MVVGGGQGGFGVACKQTFQILKRGAAMDVRRGVKAASSQEEIKI